MKCDLDWLLQWIPKAPDAEAIAQSLTLAGVEAVLHEDRTLELDLTPNRGDCLSMLGLARELSVLSDVKFDDRPNVGSVVVSGQVPPSLGSVEPEGCSYYSLRLIEGFDTQALTPQWMQERLQRCGVKPHGFLVDVTNYVMLELGQPLHAFDADTLSGPISVRWARRGESMRALDDAMLALEPDMLVIASGTSPVAVAGIIGGAHSAVTENTRQVLLESAHFLPEAIAGRARRLKLHTESSRRFERGVDPHIAHRALQRATQLIVEHAGGQVSEVSIHGSLAPEYRAEPVFLRAQQLERSLGVRIEGSAVIRILRALGCVVAARAENWEVRPPSWRFDLEIEQDLVEEVARVHGYDQLPMQRLPISAGMPEAPALSVRIEECATRLVERGYCEALSYSFTDQKLEKIFAPSATPLLLRNPISEEHAVMRTTLSGSLLRAAQHNHNRQQGSVRLFEVARVFSSKDDAYAETWVLGGVAHGAAYPLQWSAAGRAIDFYDVKGDIECLFQGNGDALRFESATHPALHPGQTAQILLGDKSVGLVGALHPKWLSEFDLPVSAFVFEVALQEWEKSPQAVFEPWSEYPAVARDLSLVLGNEVSAAHIKQCIGKLSIEELVECTVFDVYRGRELGNHRKSIGLHLKFQSFSGTLTDTEVDRLLSRVTDSLTQQLGATLR